MWFHLFFLVTLTPAVLLGSALYSKAASPKPLAAYRTLQYLMHRRGGIGPRPPFTHIMKGVVQRRYPTSIHASPPRRQNDRVPATRRAYTENKAT